MVDERGAFVGTGFFVTNEICVTCHHVISRLEQMSIQDKNKKYSVEWAEQYSDMKKDIAALRVKDSDILPLQLAAESFPAISVIVWGFSAKNLVNFPEGYLVQSDLSAEMLLFRTREENIRGDKPWN